MSFVSLWRLSWIILCSNWNKSFQENCWTIIVCVCVCVYMCVSVSVYIYSTYSIYNMLPSLNHFIMNSSCKDSVIFNIPRIVCICRNGCYTHHIPTIWITLNQIHQMLIWFTECYYKLTYHIWNGRDFLTACDQLHQMAGDKW